MITKDLITTTGLIKDKQIISADDVAFQILPDQNLDVKALTSVGSEILDTAYEKVRSNVPLQDLTEKIWDQMEFLKNSTSEKNWQFFISTVVEAHPVRKIILEDPCTHHSITRPRGYPGDAGLLDYYYGFSNVATDISPVGLEVLKVNVNVPAAWAVRKRLRILAEYIDSTLMTVKRDPRVLSIACGYLRELQYSRKIEESSCDFFALDHDEKSLQVVQKDWGNIVKTCKLSVFSMLRGRDLNLGEFDLIYAAGLYDYLNDDTAVQLSKYLLQYVRPGGKLVITNFLSSSNCSGYLEAFMDWHLIYRSLEDMERLYSSIDSNGKFSKKIYTEENNQIVFLEISKNL